MYQSYLVYPKLPQVMDLPNILPLRNMGYHVSKQPLNVFSLLIPSTKASIVDVCYGNISLPMPISLSVSNYTIILQNMPCQISTACNN